MPRFLDAILGLALTFVLSGCAATAPAAPPPVYVALGASDSVGIGAPDPARDGWVPQLQQRLPPGARLVNLGVSGAKIADAVQQQLPVAAEQRADLVTIWLAVNDFNARVPLDRYERDLDRLLTAVQATQPRRVLIGNIPALEQIPVYSVAGVSRQQLQADVARWNEVIARQAAHHGATLVDLHSGWTELAGHPEYVSGDGFHPSAAGYQRLADIFYTTLQQTGGLD